MSVSRINIDEASIFISLGLSEEEIESNDLRIEDTIELDKIVEEVNKRKNDQ